MNRSRSAVSEPMRAAMPSEMTSTALVRNSERDLRLVGLQLVEGAVERGVFVAGVFQLDDAERQAVDEDHDVRPAVRLVLDHGELVDRQPVVGVRDRRSRSAAPARRRWCRPRGAPRPARPRS